MLQIFGVWESLPVLKNYIKGGFCKTYNPNIHKIQNTTLVKYNVVCCYPTSSCLLTANALLYLPSTHKCIFDETAFLCKQIQWHRAFFISFNPYTLRLFFMYSTGSSTLDIIHFGMGFTMLEYICFLFKQCLFCLLYYVRTFSLWIFNREFEKVFFG